MFGKILGVVIVENRFCDVHNFSVTAVPAMH